jgi:hypothetical protein
MTILDRNKAHPKILSISIILLQNKVINDNNIVSILDCVDENLSEVEYSDSNNEIGDYLIAKVAYQIVNKVTGKQCQ